MSVSDRMKQMENHAPTYRSGFVGVLGKPNVGKSTLLNSLLGQKVAAVSPKPQTTRKRQLGILTLDNAQIIIVDTPGIHKPRHKLGEYMLQEATDNLSSLDLILMMVDCTLPPDDEDRQLVDVLVAIGTGFPVILLLNKVDRADLAEFTQRQSEFTDLLPDAKPLAISATRGEGLPVLLEEIVDRLPEGPPLYPGEQITDLYERDIVADLIRESALLILRDEVPHGIAVRIDQFIERGDQGAYIEATLFVERNSHKGIVIGQGGAMLKKIGTTARKQIEAMSGRKVYIRLRVKVRKNWRNDERTLRWFGF